MAEHDDFIRALTRSYQDYGYVHVRELLTSAAATGLRRLLVESFAQASRYPGDIYDHPRLGDVRIEIFNRYPQVWQTVFDSALIDVLKVLLGEDFVLLPESAIHHSGYGTWHKDTDSQQKAGHTFHWEEDCDIVQIALYCQANTEAYGGGLEVIPGSHRVDLRWYDEDLRGHRVLSEAGDLVIFNSRLDHKACWPTEPVPSQEEKYAVFFMASRNNAHAHRYLDFIRSRPSYGYLQDFSYPPALRRLAQGRGFTLLA